MLAADNPSLIRGPFADVMTIRQTSPGGMMASVRGIYDAVGAMLEHNDLVDVQHRTQAPQATFAAADVASYGEGDEISRAGRTHTILDVVTDGVQTTFSLTAGV